MQKELKKQMQRELEQYYDNKKMLENLKVQQGVATRRYIYLEERILFVENVIKRLNDFEKEMFKLIFKEKADCTYCQTYKNISKSTYYNVINKSIYLLAQEWGIT